MKINITYNSTIIRIKFLLPCLAVMVILLLVAEARAQFVHPGISHKRSDLDRMKFMVEAGIEPWVTTFEHLSSLPRAKYDYEVNVDPALTTTYNSESYNWFLNDGTAAYYNALMWYITGDSRHADKAIEILNTWNSFVRNEMSIPLSTGRIWRIIEAAEIIAHTYDGWAESDIQKFKDMLVYPGYSSFSIPESAISSNDITFYWRIYNGDPARHGNQGLFAMRTMLAMAIFLDNEIMYDRVLRYLRGDSHRSDDLPYPPGPPITSGPIGGCEYFDEYALNGFESTVPDYGYNEVISNYIYENGQCQESSRDQAHGLAGITTITVMAEMAWNQGDDIYGHLDNRPLLGLEFYYRYNLSYNNTYEDQLSPWEPSIESGEYIERSDRSGRWTALKINPYLVCSTGEEFRERAKHNLMPVYEMNLGHYRDRMKLPEDEYKWLQRGFDYMTDQIGFEGEGVVTDHPGYGGLKFRRVSPGDPISGFDKNNKPLYAMSIIPGKIEAEHFDYFTTSGEGTVYHDKDAGNTGGAYRLDEGVDLETCSEGGYQLSSLEDGEWLTYSVQIPETSLYNISIRYASSNAEGKIKFSFNKEDVTDEVIIPYGGENSNGLDDWKNLTVASDVILKQGAQPMKITIGGSSGAFVMNHISIENGSDHDCEGPLPAVGESSRFTPGVNYSHYLGNWENLPDFDGLEADSEGIEESIGLIEGLNGESYGLVFEGHIKVPIDGIYTFYTSSSDGSRLLLDGVEVVNNDGRHEFKEESGDICLEVGFHMVRLEYFNSTGEDALSVMYSGPTISKQAINNLVALGECENQPIEAPIDLEPGVSYKYYEGDWTVLPDFNTITPIDAGNLAEISLSPSIASDHFGFTFEGYINIQEEADYTFYTNSDDGSKLYIDNIEVVDNDGAHGVEEAQGTICLASGYHKLRVEYFEATGGNSLAVMYQGSNIDKQPLNDIFTGPAHQRVDQIITFSDFPVVLVGDEDFLPTASSDSGLPLSFNSSNLSVASIVDGQVRVISNGVTEITASQAGNWMYHPAADVSQTLNVFKEEGCVLPWTKETTNIKDQTLNYSSELIDISCISSASVSMKILGTSGLLSEDYLNVYYSVDEGDPQIMAEIKGSFTSQEFEAVDIAGESIRVYFESLSSTANGTYRLSDISVSEYISQIDLPLSSIQVDSHLKLYPNPASEFITLEIGDLNINVLKIYSIHGKVLFERSISPDRRMLEIDVRNFSQGIYLLRTDGNDVVDSILKILK